MQSNKKNANRLNSKNMSGATQKVSTAKRLLFKRNIFVPFIISVTCLLVICAIFLIVIRSSRPRVSVVDQKCGQHILEQAKSNLEQAKIGSLEEQVNQILAIPDYESDVNCMYFVTAYYINISDASNAKRAYEALKTAYNPDTGYNQVIADSAMSMADLQSTINFLENSTRNNASITVPSHEGE